MSRAYRVIAAPKWGQTISEDAYRIVDQGDRYLFAAVVDGHGIPLVGPQRHDVRQKRRQEIAGFADFIAEAFADRFKFMPTPSNLPHIFREIQREDVEVIYPKTDMGVVAGCIAMYETELFIAHMGDVRLYVGLPSGEMRTVIRLTNDHQADTPGEQAYLRVHTKTGGFRLVPHRSGDGGVTIRLHRTDPSTGKIKSAGLIPVRGFGNHYMRPAFRTMPDIREIDHTAIPDGSIFALCTDGAHKAVAYALQGLTGNPSDLDRVVKTCRSNLRYNRDDATVVFIRP